MVEAEQSVPRGYRVSDTSQPESGRQDRSLQNLSFAKGSAAGGVFSFSKAPSEKSESAGQHFKEQLESNTTPVLSSRV